MNDDIQRVRERMVDDHNELKGEHQAILSAIRAGFRDATAHREAQAKNTDKSSNFNIYWMIGTVAVAIIAAYARLRGA